MTSPPPRHTGFSRYVEAEDADILIVTETKTPEIKLAALDDRYEYRFWGDHTVKKGQAGTAIFSKIKPLNVTRGFTESDEVTAADSEGRMITLEFDNSYVVGTCAWCEPSLSLLLFLLRPSVASPFTDAFPRSDAPDVPNAGAGLKSLPDKEKWNRAFETYLRSLDAKKPIVWAGDLNVVPSPLDIRNWKTNYNKSAGCTDAEIEGFKRQLNPEEGTGHGRSSTCGARATRTRTARGGRTTHTSSSAARRALGGGSTTRSCVPSSPLPPSSGGAALTLRAAHTQVSERLMPRVKACEVRHAIYGASDHLPIVLDLEGPL